ncbi:MAG TPA: acetoacetate--CoA ligase, partial [Solirubrobacterales bacterium]|nr:acetoacetate--CoA ligase [Solirubrobacterales bacterium]
MSGAAPEKLWEPPAELVERSRLREFMRWLQTERGLGFATYDELWQWSVDDLEAFWSAIWDFFGVQADGEYERALGSREMPGAEWFAGTSLNYAEHVFAGKEDAEIAILHASELRDLGELSWGELRTQVAATAAGLRALGVERGDRVVAYMPNITEAIVAFLATASIGAIWSSCSPDFGPASVIDRFAQIEPKVLFAVDGYRYGGKDFDRRETLVQLQAEMPSLLRTVVLPYLDSEPDLAPLRDAVRWDELLAPGEGADLSFERVPFDHPLWVLYSSGTTGLPKAIVQSQGGILLEHLKKLHLHVDAHPGDRLFWFTTTGWMMWNFLVSGLLTRAAIVLYDGNPGHPDMGVLWELAERAGITMFGTSAAYIAACMKAGVEPGAGRDLSRLKSVGSTGSPLAPEGFDWIYEQIGADTWLFSTSGGTDLCTAFVGGCALLPVYRGELQARALGAAVEAWDEDGKPLIDAVGELVVTKPMPSMPVFFWGDPDGSRYRESYFEFFPGAWRHGDWIEITSRGTAVIYGRSDSTINRGGIRMGTSEIYRAVLSLDQIVDALVVDVPRPDTDGWMPLFIVLREDAELDEGLRKEIARRVRAQCSPRHVPDEVFAIEA